MGLNLDEKKAVVAEVSAEVAKAQAIVVAEYRGLEVGNMTELRRQARNAGVYLRVLKNTLARRAVKDTPFEKLSDQMVGPLIYGMSSDPVATAKVMNEFAKANDKLVIKAGAMPNSLISSAEVKALANMPSRDELIAKYADDLKNKCGMVPDIALLTKVTIGCGPSIYNADAQTVAGSQASELETVRTNFLIKKLGLADGPSLMAAIQSVLETYGKSERNKYRAVVYYMLVKHFGKEAVYK